MRCGHCKTDGVDRDHVRACSTGTVKTAPSFDALDLAIDQAAADADAAELLAELSIHRTRAASIPTFEDAAARAARVVAGNGGTVATADAPATARPVNPATEKQEAFIRRLANERAADESGEDPRSIAEVLGTDVLDATVAGLTKREASQLIDAWLTLPHAKAVAANDGPAPETALENGHLDRGAVHLIDGVYHRVHIGQKSGKPYVVRAVVLKEAVRADDGTLLEVGEVDWEYCAGLAGRLRPNTLVTGDEAAAFGELVGRCCFCSTPIDTPESTKAGYGPKCAADRGLPWG